MVSTAKADRRAARAEAAEEKRKARTPKPKAGAGGGRRDAGTALPKRVAKNDDEVSQTSHNSPLDLDDQEYQSWRFELLQSAIILHEGDEGWGSVAEPIFQKHFSGTINPEAEPLGIKLQAMLDDLCKSTINRETSLGLCKQIWAELKVLDGDGDRATFIDYVTLPAPMYRSLWTPATGKKNLAAKAARSTTKNEQGRLGGQDGKIKPRDKELQQRRHLSRKDAGEAEDDFDSDEWDDDEKKQILQAKRSAKRIEQMSRRTDELVVQCIGEFRPCPSWPWRGTSRAARTSIEILPRVFRGGGRARDYIERFLTGKGLMDHAVGDQMLLLAELLDQLLLYDGGSLCNMSSVEIISRRLAGYFIDLKKVRCESDLGTKRGNNLQHLDLIHFDGDEGSAAMKEVTAERRTEAEYQKWLAKSHNAPGPGASGV